MTELSSITIGVLNLMPNPRQYMSLIKKVMPKEVQLEWIYLNNHKYSPKDLCIIKSTHQRAEVVFKKKFDGIIVTGMPKEKIDFLQVDSWQEINDILSYTVNHTYSILGICWGAFALGKIFFNLNKFLSIQKIFGIYLFENKSLGHLLYKGIDKHFYCPQTRWAIVDDISINKCIADKSLIKLDNSKEIGCGTLTNITSNIIMHFGHLEYSLDYLMDEYNFYNPTAIGTAPDYPFNLQHQWDKTAQIFFKNWITIIRMKKQAR